MSGSAFAAQRQYVGGGEMELPPHIAGRIRRWVEETPKDGHHVDHECARYGGISLMGTIGATWLLRPDGTFWEVDDDFGRPLRPLPPVLHVPALVSGTRRHSWLVELLPTRPVTALDCGFCAGTGSICVSSCSPSSFCQRCSALGWTLNPERPGES